ncbi:precorrin-6A synthase (deacetylating) [Corynebacterium sp. TAE3-ERU30]|uniref:precorrin-6A synthase (deacetylating) n=1 Tax=Corynebacterium sp. TAE3-ERU30 TaxID=2849496 RepID=UPI001C462D8A|nr:precorrin-6A synthase (deacetylating) [Corynebacterium sp. TAE3-ERU30]MBV7281363.1 precorrin-6A synthase (deacetylating) [Corynebacterium sp. TAE3-ERU30]
MNDTHICVIGIGAGSPGHITQDAIAALASADCVLSLDKGEDKAELLAVRERIIAAHAPQVKLVAIADPPRDRHPENYAAEVKRWHQARAQRIDAALGEHLPNGGTAAFLVWGDPSLYDSTLRILDRLHTPHTRSIYPGITAIQALTAAHGMLLNRIGEAIHVTTARKLPETSEADRANCVVMLDGGAAWMENYTENTVIYWGAYLSTDWQVLRRGKVCEIGAEIAELKKQLRAEHGWIMDIYLLREEPAS